MRDNLFYIKSSKSIEIQKEKEIILEIDLGTIYSRVGIMKNGNVIIFTDEFSDDRRIPSVVCLIDDRWIIGVTARNLMIEYSESSLYESKRLIGLKYSNPQVQEYIKDGL